MPLTKIQPGSYASSSIRQNDISANVTSAFATADAFESYANTTTAALTEITTSLAPKVTSVAITNSSFIAIDDTAVDTNGGYIIITGENFQNGATVVVDATTASAVTYINSTTLRVQVPPRPAATYNLFVVNPDGGTGIKVSGVTYSGSPIWVTTSPLTQQVTGVPFVNDLVATGATSYAVANGSTLPAGTSLLANGRFYGTPNAASQTTYSFDVVATDAELQDSPKTFSQTIRLPNYSYQFAAGRSDLTFPANQGNLTIGGSDYTVEAWIKGTGADAVVGGGMIFMGGQFSERNSISSFFTGSTVYQYLFQYGNIAVANVPQNQWNHIAWVRQSGVLKVYVNGVLAVTEYSLGYSSGSGNSICIGGDNQSGFYRFVGLMSNFRLVIGSAVYTSNFTPPTTQLTAIPGTAILTCQSATIRDNSTNNWNISLRGTVTPSLDTPF